MFKMDAGQLRIAKSTEEQKAKINKNPVYIILDNVMDTYNIGAIFRLADAVSASKVYLCGQTETPPNSRIKKASINTTEWVDWEYVRTAKDAILNLRTQVPGVQIIAVELDERSVDYDNFGYVSPFALVVGHETNGVSKEVLDMADAIVDLPMWGVNISLNVMVSLGIVLYAAMSRLKQDGG